MSSKLKTIGKAETFDAIYPGDTAYRAFKDASGALHVMEMPSQDSVTLTGKAASSLLRDLRDVDRYGYDDGHMNATHHWLMARAFERAHPPRESVPTLGPGV